MSFLSSRLLQHGMHIDRYGNLNADGFITARGGITGSIGAGKSFFVDPANGDDNRNGKSPKLAKATLAAGYALLTAGQNDTLYLIDAGTGVALTAQFTWAKARTHLVGVSLNTGFKKLMTIANTAEDTGGQFIISANECSFSNVAFAHQGAAATTINVELTGDDLVFDDVQFRNMDNTATADEAGMLGVRLNGCNRATFRRCIFGGTHVERTDGAADLTIGPGTITGLWLDNCLWIANLDAAADADHAFIETVADADLGDFAYMESPTFVNSGAHAALPTAMTIGASTAGFFLIRDPLLVYITDIADNEEKVWVSSYRDTTPGKFEGIAVNPDVT